MSDLQDKGWEGKIDELWSIFCINFRNDMGQATTDFLKDLCKLISEVEDSARKEGFTDGQADILARAIKGSNIDDIKEIGRKEGYSKGLSEGALDGSEGIKFAVEEARKEVVEEILGLQEDVVTYSKDIRKVIYPKNVERILSTLEEKK